MLEFSLEANILQRLIASIKPFCETLSLVATSNGITMQVIDSCHAALIVTELSCDLFDLYRCTEEQVHIGIKLDALQSICNIAPPAQILHFLKEDNNSNDPDHGQYLHFKTIVHDEAELQETIKGKLNLVDPPQDLLESKNSDQLATVLINSEEFAKELSICNNLGLATASLSLTRNSFTLEATGSAKYRKTLSSSDSNINIVCKRNVSQEFATHYLLKFSKAQILGKKMEISISEEGCSTFRFGIMNSKNDPIEGKLIFRLAPRLF